MFLNARTVGINLNKAVQLKMNRRFCVLSVAILPKRFLCVPIVFKGSGFYVTDSNNSKNSAISSSSNGEGSLSIESAKCPAAKKGK